MPYMTKPPSRSLRRDQAEFTRSRILTSALAVAEDRTPWSLDSVTVGQVAAAADVSERTVYRYFPTVASLHEAILHEWSAEAGVAYENLEASDLAQVARRSFTSLARFYDPPSRRLDNEALANEEDRRIAAIQDALAPYLVGFEPRARACVMGIFDSLWSIPTYRRLARMWNLTAEEAGEAAAWAIEALLASIEAGSPTPEVAEAGDS
jgi:AcrR family transcriptional regulator